MKLQTHSRRGTRFDVFLIHRHSDRHMADSLAQRLRSRGVQPWLDSEQVIPGEWFQDALQAALVRVSCAAILIGRRTPGGWQDAEMKVAISLCIRRNIWVIPVLLPGVTRIPKSLRFLQEMHCVQFEKTTFELNALLSLMRGIRAACARRRTNDRSRSRSRQPASVKAVA